MSFRNNLLSLIILPGLLLAGCGGGGEFNVGGGNGGEFNVGGGNGGDLGGDGGSESGGSSDGDGSTGGAESTSIVSYLPLSIYTKYSDFVEGIDENNVFVSESSYPYVRGYLINPIDSTTLLPVTSATVDDYKMTIDDIEIDPTETFPLLQKVIGNPVRLLTALVFDVTGSSSDVDLDALKSEAKSYVAKAQAHSNSLIANQRFVVWSFGEDDPNVEDVKDLTGGFTTSAITIDNAIDGLTLLPAASSNLHKAIVKVIGGYADDTVTPAIDYGNDGNNDLDEVISSNGIWLSQIVVFSSGSDTKREFAQSQMIQSIQSQGLLQYDVNDSGSLDNFTSKPVFYYVLGKDSQGSVYTALSDESEKTSYLTLSSGAYTFSDSLIVDQISAIESRIDLDNQYIYRYAFLPRQGSHVRVFSSKSEDFNYSLTGNADFPSPVAVGTPYYELESSVEITGANGEYISGAYTGQQPTFTDGEYLTGGQISLSEMNTFRPVTRWTNDTFQSTDYVWGITNGTGVANADGSYTVSSLTGSPATLQVDNTVNSQRAFITLTN